jgi:hypothetical protein
MESYDVASNIWPNPKPSTLNHKPYTLKPPGNIWAVPPESDEEMKYSDTPMTTRL